MNSILFAITLMLAPLDESPGELKTEFDVWHPPFNFRIIFNDNDGDIDIIFLPLMIFDVRDLMPEEFWILV